MTRIRMQDGYRTETPGIGRRGFLAGDAFDPILPGEPGPVPVHPVAAAFNAMGLDYFTLGNHDFNFGYEAFGIIYGPWMAYAYAPM